jgi:hypothetical protein
MTVTIHPEVIAELRSLFKAGATPSRLIQHILARQPDEPDWFWLVQEYFSQAFSVPLVRIAKHRPALQAADLSQAFLNVHLLHQMLEKRSEWDRGNDTAATESNPWFQTLVATDEVELIRKGQPASIPELAKSWDRLDPDAKGYIQQLIGNLNALYEKILVLARLAECLQQKIVHMENKSTAGNPTSNDRPAERG